VPQQLLDGSDIVAVLEEMRRERVTEGMGTRALGRPRLTDSPLHGPLQDRLVQVMASALAGNPSR
jgi:hypothetical protein